MLQLYYRDVTTLTSRKIDVLPNYTKICSLFLEIASLMKMLPAVFEEAIQLQQSAFEVTYRFKHLTTLLCLKCSHVRTFTYLNAYYIILNYSLLFLLCIVVREFYCIF